MRRQNWYSGYVTNIYAWHFLKSNISPLVLKDEFDSKSSLNCSRDVFIKRFCFFSKARKCLEFSCVLKEIGSRWKLSKESITKQPDNFLRFSVVSPHHKWNRARILSVEIECSNILASCLNTYGLQFYEWTIVYKMRNYKRGAERSVG